MPGSAIRTRFYKTAFWAVATGSIATVLGLAAIDRLLLGSAVVFLGGIPAAALACAAQRLQPTPTDAEKLVTAWRTSIALTAIGTTAILVGAVLMLMLHGTVGHLPQLLLWTGATAAFGGGTAYRETRARMHE